VDSTLTPQLKALAMSEALHSKFSASAAKRWMSCPGSMVLQVGVPDRGSKYADEGTRAHQAAEAVLRGQDPAYDDGDMRDHVGVYLDNLKQYADGAELMVEQRLNYSTFLGLPTDVAWGTSDAVIIKGDEIQVHDLKYGQGEIVSPANNPQMQLYALGALAEFDGLAGDFKHVRMVIHQPRVTKAPQEWDCTVDELRAFGDEAKQAVHLVRAAEHGFAAIAAGTKTREEWEEAYLKPTDDGCRWCRVKATCPKLRAEVVGTVVSHVPSTPEEFADLSVPGKAHIAPTDDAWLSAAMGKADLIEDWLMAVRAEVERRLLAGTPVTGFKLVQGRQGNRAWVSEEEAEKLLKVFKLKQDEMYNFKVISPTQAEKLLAESSPRRWAKAQEIISRADGKPSVAPLSDKRAALEIKPVAEQFDDLSVADDIG
jgi:hypothetical protein